MQSDLMAFAEDARRRQQFERVLVGLVGCEQPWCLPDRFSKAGADNAFGNVQSNRECRTDVCEFE